ncbi:MAG: hypothetical protein CME98_02410 [Hyphomonas sp.]|nr:hypothetical protein [Hyphomonas sp.]
MVLVVLKEKELMLNNLVTKGQADQELAHSFTNSKLVVVVQVLVVTLVIHLELMIGHYLMEQLVALVVVGILELQIIQRNNKDMMVVLVTTRTTTQVVVVVLVQLVAHGLLVQ